MWDLWWTQWDRDWFFSECVGFPLLVSFHQYSILVFIGLLSTVCCLDNDRVIKYPVHLYLYYWTSLVYLLPHSPSFRSHEANNLSHYRCMLCKAALRSWKSNADGGAKRLPILTLDQGLRRVKDWGTRFVLRIFKNIMRCSSTFWKYSIWTKQSCLHKCFYDDYRVVVVCLLACCGWFVLCVGVLLLQIDIQMFNTRLIFVLHLSDL
jgi:hypothetical protein